MGKSVKLKDVERLSWWQQFHSKSCSELVLSNVVNGYVGVQGTNKDISTCYTDTHGIIGSELGTEIVQSIAKFPVSPEYKWRNNDVIYTEKIP